MASRDDQSQACMGALNPLERQLLGTSLTKLGQGAYPFSARKRAVWIWMHRGSFDRLCRWLKREQMKKRIYQTRAEARSKIFDDIEGFTIECVVTSTSINSVPTSSRGSVKLRCENCLKIWGNARHSGPGLKKSRLAVRGYMPLMV